MCIITLFFPLLYKVYGFLQTSLNEAERGQGYPVGIGYIKRPPTVTALLRGDISVDAGGTASKQLREKSVLISVPPYNYCNNHDV